MADLALMSTEGRPALAKEDVRRLSSELGETDNGLAWRLAALTAYRNEPLPERVKHLWRYTDPVHLMPTEVLPAAMPPRDLVAAELPEGEPAVLLVPGRLPQLNEAARAAGLQVTPLLHDDGDAELLGTASPDTSGFFAALNSVAWNAGVAVYVPAGKALEQPLRLLVARVRRDHPAPGAGRGRPRRRGDRGRGALRRPGRPPGDRRQRGPGGPERPRAPRAGRALGGRRATASWR